MLRLLLAASFIFLSIGTAAAASCPHSLRDDGKRLTVTGTVSKVGRTNGGDHYIEIRECQLFYIVTTNLNGCRTGKKITAVGTMWSCDELSAEMTGCYEDMLDESRVTCR